MHQNPSTVRWRFDPEHIRYDTEAIIQAAKNGIDKIIHTGPLAYVASSSTAMALELEDSLCSVLYGPNWARPLKIANHKEQFLINWPSAFRLHDTVIDILGKADGSHLLSVPVDPILVASIRKAAQPGAPRNAFGDRKL